MKKLILLFCFFLLITLTTNEAKAFYQDNELSQITQIAKQNNIFIDNWSMYIKEPIRKYSEMKDLDRTIDDIKDTEKDYSWSKKKFVKDYYKIEGKKKTSIADLEEKVLIIIYSQSGKYNLSVTYDIKGKWDETKWPAIFNMYKNKIEDYSAFYTIQGTKNINQSLYTEASKLLTNFSGEEIQSLNETKFVSLSAYTKRWENKLPLGDNQYMNLHIAYRETSESTNQVKVTIGTPIITSEY